MARPTKVELVRREREQLDRKWREENERIRRSESAFESLPDCAAKIALQVAMTDRIVQLYNECRFEEGDAILEFLPSKWAHQLLDWYFDEDETTPHPAQAAAEQHEAAQPRQVQDQPQQPGGPHGEHPVQADAIGEPSVLKPLIRCGEGDPASDPGLAEGSPMVHT